MKKATKRPSKRLTAQEKLAQTDLSKIHGISRSRLLKELADSNEMAIAFLNHLQNNDPEGAMEVIELYLNAIETIKLRRKAKWHEPISPSFKYRNPTIKTLAKIMYEHTH
jgi:hypothetical protein